MVVTLQQLRQQHSRLVETHANVRAEMESTCVFIENLTVLLMLHSSRRLTLAHARRPEAALPAYRQIARNWRKISSTSP